MSTTYVQILMPDKGTVFSNSVDSVFGVVRSDVDNATFIALSTSGRQTVCKSVELFLDNLGEILTIGEAIKRLGKKATPKDVRSKYKKLSPFVEADISKVLGRKPEPIAYNCSGQIHLPRPVGVFNAADNRVNSNAISLDTAVLLDPAVVNQMTSSKIKAFTYESIDYDVKPPAIWWYYLSVMEGNIKTSSLNVDERKVVNKITLQNNIWKVPDIF
jgi:hypothetical protein